MGRKRRREGATDSGPATVGRGRAAVLVVVVGVAVGLAIVTWRKSPAPGAASSARLPGVDRPAAPATTQPRPPTTAATSKTSGEAPPELRPLIGEWVRTDGGYVLSVSSIARDGEATVDYFNPRPIHVQRARARGKEGSVELFVELRDRGYPGSTYTLTHDAGADELEGTYFQAAQRASYDVVFVRR